MKQLVVYFSVEYGNTKKIAEAIANDLKADIVSIEPKKPYTKSDINWRNPLSRCNREFFTKKKNEIATKVDNMSDYDEIYVGFPIWYGCAPLVVNDFLSEYDLTGKKLYVFATSGGSGIGKTAEKLAPFTKGAEIIDCKLTQTIDDALAFLKR